MQPPRYPQNVVVHRFDIEPRTRPQFWHQGTGYTVNEEFQLTGKTKADVEAMFERAINLAIKEDWLVSKFNQIHVYISDRGIIDMGEHGWTGTFTLVVTQNGVYKEPRFSREQLLQAEVEA